MASNRQEHLNQALMRIPRRAESTDRHALARTYVKAGSFSAMLHSTDHQILYGRRGTGKTHALLYLAELVARTGDLPVYLDLRTIGSSDASTDLALRGTQLLVDTLEAVHEELLTAAVDRKEHEGLLPALDPLAEAATEVRVVGEVERETTFGNTTEGCSGFELATQPKLSGSRRRAVTQENRLRRTGVEQHQVVFGPLHRALRGIVRSLDGARLWLLLDEWSSVPLELQPLLADLLRRSVLPTSGITVKIAAIERRSCFSTPGPAGDYVGIEVGADAASAVSLDDSMLFDGVRAKSQEFFGQLFYSHAAPALARMISAPPCDVASFLHETFRRNAFAELVRAAEGVPRDAINIAALAAQHAHDEPIGLGHVRQAARDWYLRDKHAAVSRSEPATRALRLLVDEVVGRRRSRTFLIDQLTKPEAVEALHDARLLHLLRRGIVDKRHPGRLYEGFAIDFGCYVSLLLDGGLSAPPRDRTGWLDSPKTIPPDTFDFAHEAVDLAKLG